MIVYRRFLLWGLIAAALLSSCTSLCCDKASARIEADIAIATDRKEDAEAACVRVGGHLCTTAQWKQACRGTANTDFPYGATFQPKTCNGHAYDLINPHVLPTDQPGGTCVSTFGAAKIYNMSGNLKEWTATGFSAGKPTGYGINGGAYDTPSIDTYGAGLSCTYDLPAPSSSLQLPTLGFRCCK